jgi:hypothetical protein
MSYRHLIPLMGLLQFGTAFGFVAACVQPEVPHGPASDCASACARLRELQCSEAEPTEAGATCEQVCENFERPSLTACVARAADCDSANLCQ